MIFFLNTLNYSEQVELIKSLRVIILEYPFFSPTTPRFNKPFKIKTTNAGKWGWTSDVTGYKYIRKHPKYVVAVCGRRHCRRRQV